MNISINLSSQIKAAKDKKTLNKPFRTSKGPKKFSVYVKNEKGNIVKVNFGDPNMEIKRDDPKRRKNFRSRMGGIKKKDGSRAVDDPFSPAYHALRILW